MLPINDIRSRNLKKNIDIETDSPASRRSLILNLTLPALGENVLASLVSVIDLIMVGTLGAFAIGAVGLNGQPYFLMLAAFQALNVGATAVVSRFKGAGNRESANQVLCQAMIITMGIAIVLCLAMFFGGEPFIRFLAGENISEETIQGAIIYLRIQVYGFPALALTFTVHAVLRGVGNTSAAFYDNLVKNILKIFFNYCLISGKFGFPAMGLMGASLATVIGTCVAMFMALSRVLSRRGSVRLYPQKLFTIDISMIRRILKIGLPSLMEQVIMRTGMLLFTVIVTSLGNQAYAAHMIAMNLWQIAYMPGMSFGVAATTLIGQCLGRIREDLAKLFFKETQRLNFIISVAVTAVVFAGASQIASLFTSDPDIAIQAANMMKLIAVVNPMCCARWVCTSALRGAGDSRFVAMITLIGVLVVRPLSSVILVFPLFPFQLGLTGVWIAISIDMVVCYFIARARFNKGKWASIQV